MKGPESYVKDEVKKHLRAMNAFYFMPVQYGYGKSALDFLVCVKGEFWGIETKKPGVREPTKRQAAVMKEIRAAGGRTFLVTEDEELNLMWIEIND